MDGERLYRRRPPLNFTPVTFASRRGDLHTAEQLKSKLVVRSTAAPVLRLLAVATDRRVGGWGGDRLGNRFVSSCLSKKETCNTISHEIRVLLHCRLGRGTILMSALAKFNLAVTRTRCHVSGACAR